MEGLRYGQPISEKLSGLLTEFTDKNDIADASAETGVSISTINYVKRRVNNVSEGNEKGILVLAKKAYENAELKRKKALKCKRELKQMLSIQ